MSLEYFGILVIANYTWNRLTFHKLILTKVAHLR